MAAIRPVARVSWWVLAGAAGNEGSPIAVSSGVHSNPWTQKRKPPLGAGAQLTLRMFRNHPKHTDFFSQSLDVSRTNQCGNGSRPLGAPKPFSVEPVVGKICVNIRLSIIR